MNTMRQALLVLACALLCGVPSGAQAPAAPANALTIDALISLKRAGSPVISPDAKWVAYTLRETNWDDNVYETEIWLADAAVGGDAATDQQPQVQQRTGLVARRQEAGVWLRPRGSAARST